MSKMLFALVLAVAAVAPMTSFASDTLVNVELKWKPTSDLSDFKKLDVGTMAGKIKIGEFTDSRKNPAAIGENREDKKGKTLPVTTKSSVGEFVSTNLKNVLTKVGVDIVDSGAEYVITGDIKDYFVTETNTYKGNITVRVTVTKAGKPIWNGVVMGTNNRFGRSYKYENYMEVMSDTVVDMATELLKNSEFRSKVK